MYNIDVKIMTRRSNSYFKQREFSVGVRKREGAVKYIVELLP